MRATFANVSETREMPFECDGCGHHATMVIVGVGEGTQSSLNRAGTAEKRAQKDLDADFERVRSVAACPSCGQRRSGAALRWWRPHLLWGIAFSGAVALAAVATTGGLRPSDQAIARWVCLGLFLFLAVGILGTAAFKWSGITSRVEFVPAAHLDEAAILRSEEE